MKTFNLQYRIGKAKYVVIFHNGVKKHNDGSDFFDLMIFHNWKKLTDFLKVLKSEGYVES
jgi:hypothetical protein